MAIKADKKKCHSVQYTRNEGMAYNVVVRHTAHTVQVCLREEEWDEQEQQDRITEEVLYVGDSAEHIDCLIAALQHAKKGLKVG